MDDGTVMFLSTVEMGRRIQRWHKSLQRFGVPLHDAIISDAIR
jgi:hypothetical protein